MRIPDEVKIDDSDIKMLSELGYVSMSVHSTKYVRLNTNEYLHRVLMQPSEGMVVDHINGDPTDNRRANLQVCTQSKNCYKKQVKDRGIVRGVCWFPQTSRWVARITIDGKRKHLGYFKEYDAAVAARRDAERKLQDGIL